MKIKDIFNLALKMGIRADFRGQDGIEKLLKRKKEKYEKLFEKERERFDLEVLNNPYLDSRIYHIAQDRKSVV